MKRSPKTRNERMGAGANTPCDDCPSSEGMGPSDDGSSPAPLEPYDVKVRGGTIVASRNA